MPNLYHLNLIIATKYSNKFYNLEIFFALLSFIMFTTKRHFAV
jgi:hypothetical protein